MNPKKVNAQVEMYTESIWQFLVKDKTHGMIAIGALCNVILRAASVSTEPRKIVYSAIDLLKTACDRNFPPQPQGTLNPEKLQ